MALTRGAAAVPQYLPGTAAFFRGPVLSLPEAGEGTILTPDAPTSRRTARWTARIERSRRRLSVIRSKGPAEPPAPDSRAPAPRGPPTGDPAASRGTPRDRRNARGGTGTAAACAADRDPSPRCADRRPPGRRVRCGGRSRSAGDDSGRAAGPSPPRTAGARRSGARREAAARG